VIIGAVAARALGSSPSRAPSRGSYFFWAVVNSQHNAQNVAGFRSGYRDWRGGDSNDFKVAYAEA